MSASPKRRVRKRWLVLGAGVLILVVQGWTLTRNASRLRLVVYNDSRAPITETFGMCAGEIALLGDLGVEESRHTWFRPSDPSAVVILKWAGAAGAYEESWSAERGERLTVRLGLQGDASMTRERSLGRRILDGVLAP